MTNSGRPKNYTLHAEPGRYQIVMGAGSARLGSLTAAGVGTVANPLPNWVVPVVVVPIGNSPNGHWIELVEPAWQALLQELDREPDLRFKIPYRTFEEVVAAGYKKAGFKVELTPRSGDRGRDVVATLGGVVEVRILESVKALGRGQRVTAEEVDALIGVVHRNNASKGILTTTAEFAPGIAKEKEYAPLIPQRLQLVDGEELVPRLRQMSGPSPFGSGSGG